ncbi:MAG TPA: LysR family transcriptional regulator, partial [Sphingobacterium sp.]|nr:LysR family transcriptional regulator [Sphingobacterium sp.]
AIASGKIKLIWEGTSPVENILYFGTRKKTMYQEEIGQLETLLKEKW